MLETASLVFSVSQTLLAVLQTPEIKGLFSTWGYESQLKDLETTINTVQAALQTANLTQENGKQLSKQEWDFIDNLNDVLYEADDIIDTFTTVLARKKPLDSSHGKVLSALLSRVSSLKMLHFSTKMSQKVKNVMVKLDRIGDSANRFHVKYADLPSRKRIETPSVNEKRIFGRTDDKEKIIGMLLDPITSDEQVSVLTIMGMGGLGKTTLAQLVYNDQSVINQFPLRLWVCVSDNDKTISKDTIIANIVKQSYEIHVGDLNIHQLVKKLQEKLKESKYLLVLDDVWTESRSDWSDFSDQLMGSGGPMGNKIIVTTRSKKTAKIVGSHHTCELDSLSDEDSWNLFEDIVKKERANCHCLADIGGDILKKCANVPLAVKEVGGALFGIEVSNWKSFQNSRPGEITVGGVNHIMPILEFSYHHLLPPLKCCFTYCALFPKDFIFRKEKIIDLWMAQNYIDSVEGKTIKETYEEYFQILENRYFLQKVENKEFEEGGTFKIHDLMHDMAQEIAKKEISIANRKTRSINKSLCHLSDDAPHCRARDFMVRTKIRTYLVAEYVVDLYQFPLISTLLAQWRSLRTLDLRCAGFSRLPDTIGQLLHLRYLDLYGNRDLKKLPKSITKLINLQFLNLDECNKLKELPKDLSKLVKLRTLYVPKRLEYMPLGLAGMTPLTRLNWFIVCDQRKSCLTLEGLRALRNLKGSLGIYIHGNYCGKGKYISDTQGLNSINIEWKYDENGNGRLGNDEELLQELKNHEELLQELKPHINLKELTICGYLGVRMAGWAREDSLAASLPYLVKIHLKDCKRLEKLPWLGRFKHLKTLIFEELKNVEYMENRSSGNDGVAASNSSTMLFFPSLEKLVLREMPKLTEWWRGMSNGTAGSGSGSRLGMGEDEIVNSDSSMLTPPAQTLLFPRLSELCIEGCPNLTSFPLCPFVEYLVLKDLNERFEGIIIKEEGEEMEVGSRSSSYGYGKIRHISTECLQHLKFPPMEAFRHLVRMTIEYDEDLKSLSEVKEVFRSCSSSLRCVILSDCKKLMRVCEGGLEYLTVLEELKLRNLPELNFEETAENHTAMPWRILGKCLRSLQLWNLEKVVNLPMGMRYFTSLQSLYINNLPLKEIPEWIKYLSSLQSLHISSCKSLETLPRELRSLTSLKSLTIDYVPLKDVPDWIDSLSSLQLLKITGCKHLDTLPRVLVNLTSLEEFHLVDCSDELKRRCKNPDGNYWPMLEQISQTSELVLS